MKTIDIDYINKELLLRGKNKIKLTRLTYPEIRLNDDRTSLVDSNGNNIGTKGDMYHKLLLDDILTNGCMDRSPRAKYEDGVPAHSLSVNHDVEFSVTYDLSKGEFPITTLRPIAYKSGIGEILWIYRDQSGDLNLLEEKYGISWWNKWDIGGKKIGMTYGPIIERHDMTNTLLTGIEKNPDGRRHNINMWQVEDFKELNALQPCAYLTEWNVRHGRDGIEYLDMKLTQRSSDFLVAGAINQVQYVAFQYMVAKHLGLTPGRFTWSFDNIQIYDRHIEQAIELLNREPVNCNPHFEVNPDITNFYDFEVDDVKLVGYPRKEIAAKNKQLTFDLGI